MRVVTLVSVGLIMLLSACSKAPQPITGTPNSIKKEPPKTATINGSVFIVTKGAENVKLGLVPVTVFEKESFTAFAESLQQTIVAAKTATESEINQQMALHEEKRGQAKESILASNRLLKYMRRGLPSAMIDILDNYKNYENYDSETLIKIHRKIQKNGDNWGLPLIFPEHYKGYTIQVARAERFQSTSKESFTLSASLVESWPNVNAAFYYTESDSAIASTKTNADGKFKLKLPASQRYVLCALGQRQMFGVDEPETYYWIVDVEFDGALEKEILLSNHNELLRNGSESPVKLVKLPYTIESSEN